MKTTIFKKINLNFYKRYKEENRSDLTGTYLTLYSNTLIVFFSDTSTSEKSTNSKVVKTEEECQFSSSNKNPDNAMYKPPSYQQPQNPQSQPQDVEYLKVVNDFLVAEVNEIKRRSQTQQATISWLLNEVSKTKEELDSLKMLQKLSNVNSENAILPPDYSSHYFDTNEINRSQEKTNHNSNLYLTNQMLKVDYPYQSRGYYDPDLDFKKNMYSPSSVSSSTQKIENVDEIDEMSYGSMRNFPSDTFEHVPQYPTFDVGQ